MKEVFIKANTFYNSELEQINKYAYRDFTNKDIISVEDLVVIIEELLGACETFEDKIDNLTREKTEDDYFDPYDRYLDMKEGII